MDEASIREYFARTFAGVEVVDTPGCRFFFYGSDHMFPFATLMTADDAYDQSSDLSRPGVFRLNVGVGKATFQALFPAGAKGDHDYTALDRLMPHPVYGKMYWVCVLNPGPETFARVRELLAEAYEAAVRKRGGAGPAGAG